MKKILLISLVLIGCDVKVAPVVETVELECVPRNASKTDLSKNFYVIPQPRREGASVKIQRYNLDFLENGKARHFAPKQHKGYWYETEIRMSNQFDDTKAWLDRETLILTEDFYWAESWTYYECQMTNNIEANLARWEQEADAFERAIIDAKKAKNVI